MTRPPADLIDVANAPCYRISPDDSVKLAIVKAPDGPDDTSVFFEVWDVDGAQPPNSHDRSVETFWFLAGEGIAECDGTEVGVGAGQFLVLPIGSVHRIRNTGAGRLWAITTMSPDDGFADLVGRGVIDALDAQDLAVLRTTDT